jgi:hypothetical protein
MRDYDEEDPRKPYPARTAKKRTNPDEAAETPRQHARKDDERDHHRHVV